MKRLEYKNSWEYDFYSVGGVPVKNIKEIVIDGNPYRVHSRDVTVPYNDMGHQHTATSKHYFVREKVFGINMEFDLNEIIRKKKVFVTDYKLVAIKTN